MNLDTTIDIDLKGFFNWWGRELVFLVPKALRQRLRDRHGCVILSPEVHGYVAVFFDDDGKVVVRRQLDLATSTGFQQLKIQYPAIEKAEIVLRLTADQAIHKLIYLPAAAYENLQQVVGFELDRYTPFSVEQVYFNAIMLGKTDHSQLEVLLIAAPKVSLDEQLLQVAALGVRPHKIDYQQVLEDFPQIGNAVNLLPDRYQHQGSKLSQSMHWITSGLLVLLTLWVLVWPIWLQGQAVDSLKTRIKQLEKQNRIVDQQQTELDALRAETQKLIDIKYQSPALLAVLGELSNLLNDETWLTHLQYSDKRIQIQGQSPAASALISVLEQSEFFSNVSFVSPLTQDKTTGRERFQISMDVSMPAVVDINNELDAAVVEPSDQNNVDIEQMPEESNSEMTGEVSGD
jgi:general secretion pathway protein L